MRGHNLKNGFLILAVGFILWPGIAKAELSLESELLIFEEVPTVVTAAKHEQPITESPVTISVITAEDIRRSGARDIQEILRRLPGIEVMVSKTSQIDVGVRGDNGTLYNRLLVMVDGRSVYQDFYGMTEWAYLEIGLEEIKRIEVIRGPGSALYGANAFTGVINIITKTPKEMKGNIISAGAGNYHSAYGNYYHGGASDNLSYKVSTGWREANRWSTAHEDSLDIGRFNSEVGYELDDENKVSLSGGMSAGQRELSITGSGGGNYNTDVNLGYLKAEYDKPDMYLRFFWNRTKFAAKKQTDSESRINGFSNIYDAEFQRSLYFDLWKSHRLTWGTSYRYNTINSEQIDNPHEWNLFAGYMQDELKLSEKLLLNAGVRLDYHPLTREEISPRGSIIYKPKEGHLIRFWAGTSFKTPSFAELYTKTTQGLLTVLGNSQLDPEHIEAYDLGYEFPLSERVNGSVNIFYNKMEKLIGTKTTGLVSTYDNSGKRNILGCETGVEFLITDYLKGFANYTVQEMRDLKTRSTYRAAPRNKFNVGFDYTLKNGFNAEITLNYVEHYEMSLGKIPAYTLMNGRIGYVFPRKDLGLALVFYNILHDEHRECSGTGDEIRTAVTMNVIYKF